MRVKRKLLWTCSCTFEVQRAARETRQSEETKLIHKFAKNIKIEEGESEENKARIVDLYIKENIYISENDSENLKKLTNVLDTKTANETGIVKLYVALFKKFNITHEMVLTSNRLKLKFDKEDEEKRNSKRKNGLKYKRELDYQLGQSRQRSKDSLSKTMSDRERLYNSAMLLKTGVIQSVDELVPSAQALS